MKFLIALISAFPGLVSFTVSEGMELTAAQELELTTAFANKLQLKAAPNPADEALLQFAKGLKLVNEKNELVEFANTVGQVVHLISETERTRVYAEAGKVTALSANAKIGEDFIAMQRDEAIRLYNLSASGAPDSAVLTLLKDCPASDLALHMKTYAKDAKMEFTAFCTKCNSADGIDMRSSYTKSDDSQAGKKVDSFKEKLSHRQHRGFDISK